MFVRYTRSDDKHRYGIHTCDFCGKGHETRIRADREHDNCGCHPSRQTHGHEKGHKPTPELKAYRKMRERCYSPNCKDYVNYGGRGIEVCPRWLYSFENFFADMGPRPSSKHSIERRNVNGSYSPLNCYWATKDVQANNTRANVFLTLDGRTQTVAQWLREFGMCPSTYYRRIKRGLSPREALSA